MKKRLLLTLSLLFLVGCSNNKSIDLSSEKEVRVDDEKLQPKEAEVIDNSIKLKMDWAFGNNDDSKLKKSLHESKISIYTYQNDNQLLPDSQLSSSLTSKNYENNVMTVDYAYELKNKFTPIGVKITDSNYPAYTQPYDLFFNIADNQQITNEEFEILANQRYVYNAMNNIQNAILAITSNNTDDAEFYIKQIEINNDFVKRKTKNTELNNYLKEFSDSINKIIKLYKNANVSGIENIEVFNKSQESIMIDISDKVANLNKKFFYTEKSYQNILELFNKEDNQETNYSEDELEQKLNDNEDVINKIVEFKTKDNPVSNSYGYDIFAGEHLNFVSYDEPNIKKDDIVIARIIDVEKIMNSYIIRYKLISN